MTSTLRELNFVSVCVWMLWYFWMCEQFESWFIFFISLLSCRYEIGHDLPILTSVCFCLCLRFLQIHWNARNNKATGTIHAYTKSLIWICSLYYCLNQHRRNAVITITSTEKASNRIESEWNLSHHRIRTTMNARNCVDIKENSI